MRRAWPAGLGLVIVLCAGTMALAGEPPTAEELAKRMEARFARIRSFEADCRYSVESRGEWESTKTWHWAMEKGEGKGLLRGFKAVQWVADEWWEKSKTVNDGTFEWVERRGSTHEGARVTKSRPSEFNILNWLVHIVRENGKLYDMKVVGKEEMDGQEMYVLEGSRTFEVKVDDEEDAFPVTLVRQKVLVGTEDLILHRWVMRSSRPGAGREQDMVETVEYFNIKVDQKIDPELFKYTPPDGTEVVDLTKGEGK